MYYTLDKKGVTFSEYENDLKRIHYYPWKTMKKYEIVNMWIDFVKEEYKHVED